MTDPQTAPNAQPPIDAETPVPVAPPQFGRISLIASAAVVVVTSVLVIVRAVSLSALRATPAYEIVSAFVNIVGVLSFVVAVVALVFGLIGLRDKNSTRLSAAAGTAIAASFLFSYLTSQLASLVFAFAF